MTARMIPPRIAKLARRIAPEHGAHTAILYGSHARGDATSRSDIDLLLVREAGPSIRDARLIDGEYLDAFVVPESAVAVVAADQLKLLGGVVLFERDGCGAALLTRVQELFDAGPAPLAADERQMRRVWAQKSLSRLRDEGPEGEYRRMFLLVNALEDYFALRGWWFRGSKHAFAWLASHDAALHQAFTRGMRSAASADEISQLVTLVYELEAEP